MVNEYSFLIPLIPLLAFAAIVLLTRKNHRLSASLAVFSIVASLVLSLGVIVEALAVGPGLAKDPFYATPIVWYLYGTAQFTMGWYIDPIGAVMLFMVPIVCLMIFIYSTAYMRESHTDEHGHAHIVDDPRYSRFFALISLFAAAMLTLVISGNLLLFFMAWEVMGFCSYALIGFWSFRGVNEHHIDDAQVGRARAAALKAFLTTRVGDVLFMSGMILLFISTGTLDFYQLFSGGAMQPLLNGEAVSGVTWATLIALLIFGGTVAKSAQFPLHIWLPDAMEGPTPVSALIHAATMVAAGVFLVARMFPLFQLSSSFGGPALQVVAIVGAFTALFAATIGIAQNDIKKVLAYSTISQLGYMLAAIGLGALTAGMFHLIAHAFFKALLFLGAGAVIHGVGTNDMFKMGGIRRKMPITTITFVIGALALMGIFPFAGFWSKDEILTEALREGISGRPEGSLALTVWIMLVLAAFFTALYTTRQLFLVFFGKPRDEHSYEHAHESPTAMWVPLVVLAIFTAILGFWNTPFAHGFFDFTGAGGLLGFEGEFEFAPFDQLAQASVVISLGAAFAGIILGWFLYGWHPIRAAQPDPLSRLGIFWRIPLNKYWLDQLYGYKINEDGTANPGLFPRFMVMISRVAYWFDRTIIDGIVRLIGRIGAMLSTFSGWFDHAIIDGVINAIGDISGEIAGATRFVQTGRVQNYALYAIAGAAIFAIVFLLRSLT